MTLCTVTQPLLSAFSKFTLQELLKYEMSYIWEICSLLLVVLCLNVTGKRVWILTIYLSIISAEVMAYTLTKGLLAS